MPAPHASPTQNQIASLRMREHDAIEMPSAPFDAIPPMQGLSGYLPTVGAIVIGAVIAFGVVASGVGMPVLIAMLVALAAVGLFFLFAYSAGYIRVGQRAPLADVVKAAADGLDVGVMIASRDGEPIYANSAFEAMVGRGERDRLVALQQFLSGDAAASSALFRLTRAAERGEALGRGVRHWTADARRAHAPHAAALGQARSPPRRRRNAGSRAVAPHRRHRRPPARGNARRRHRGAARPVRRRADRSCLGGRRRHAAARQRHARPLDRAHAQGGASISA